MPQMLHLSTHSTLRYACCAAPPPQPRRLPRSTRLAAVAGSQERIISTRTHDPYLAAAARLQSLINGVGDGEEELYYNMLLEEDPINKISVNAVLGAVVLTASSAICWLCGADLAGGASFSLHSLISAFLGAAAAIPLVAYKQHFWSSNAKQQDGSIGALQQALVNHAKPWLQGMQSKQLALHLVLDTLPVLFLMLPAAQAGLTASFSWSSAAIGRSVGLELPQEVGYGLALLMTAFVTSAVRSSELVTDPQQVTVVGEAVANADRYYRLTTGSASGNQEYEARKAATAFKAVAVSWREQEQQMTSLFVRLQVLDILYLGVLWYLTHDMTAPCVAALLANGVDYHHMWCQVQQSSRLGCGGGGGGPQQRKQRDSSVRDSSR